MFLVNLRRVQSIKLQITNVTRNLLAYQYFYRLFSPKVPVSRCSSMSEPFSRLDQSDSAVLLCTPCDCSQNECCIGIIPSVANAINDVLRDVTFVTSQPTMSVSIKLFSGVIGAASIELFSGLVGVRLIELYSRLVGAKSIELFSGIFSLPKQKIAKPSWLSAPKEV